MNIIENIIIPQFNTLQLGKIHKITPIEQGVSQHCFHVEVVSNTVDIAPAESTHTISYIIKAYINAKGLISLREFNAYKAFNNQWPYSAKLIGSANNILVLEKLAGHTLSDAKETYLIVNNEITEKLDIAAKIMADVHQIPVKQFGFCETLNFSEIFSELLSPSLTLSLNTHLSTELLIVIEQNITSLLNNHNKLFSAVEQDDLAICHGDLNFGNIIVNNQFNHIKHGEQHNDEVKFVSVIDFESLCLMPPEYDIAMCLAVNEIASTSISHAIACYEKYLVLDRKLNTALIENYYELSLYINGLWYLQQSLDNTIPSNKTKQLYKKSISQFNLLLHTFTCSQEKALFKTAFS